MTSQALNEEIYDLADAIASTDPELATAAYALVNLHRTHRDADETGPAITRLIGENSLIALIALITEGIADTQPIHDLPAGPRHTAKAALHHIAAELTHLTTRGHADQAAHQLDNDH